ncbi:MAG: hypothetical protein MUE87_05830 [Methanothrix sp.]|nr:hypothetical protein [Methanothrix sp.]
MVPLRARRGGHRLGGCRPGSRLDVRICAGERGYELCSSCHDLEGCTKFEWLGEHDEEVRELMKGEPGG